MIYDGTTGEILEIVEKTPDGLIVSPDAIAFITQAEQRMKEIKTQYDEYKAALLEAMERYGIDKIDTDNFTASYVAPHMATRVDSKRLASEYPEVYDDVTKASYVKGSVRVRLR